MQNLLPKLDIFSNPYTFRWDKSKVKNRTSFGGILTILIIFLSLLYFIYLMIQYANGERLPTLTQRLIE